MFEVFLAKGVAQQKSGHGGKDGGAEKKDRDHEDEHLSVFLWISPNVDQSLDDKDE